ncbi:MAG: hypothetical protein MZV49_09115 [Rhodopseudomonas palustris]|nr:hypothetical protein [Rhodopseudomonas palustris]
MPGRQLPLWLSWPGRSRSGTRQLLTAQVMPVLGPRLPPERADARDSPAFGCLQWRNAPWTRTTPSCAPPSKKPAAASHAGEVPVGAVVVLDGRVVGPRVQPADRRERPDGPRRDRRAARGRAARSGNYRLVGTTCT